MRKKILCIQGGGINGIVAAQILADMEDQLTAASGGEPQYVGRYFDMIAGTSTGGIIALALALRIPARSILDLYVYKASSVFSGPRFKVVKIMRKIFRTGVGMPWYARENLDQELRKTFEGKSLGNAKTRLVVPVFNVESGKIEIFKTQHHELFQNDFRVPAADVAAGTSAAPVYFEKHRFGDGRSYVDGGIWANNPSAIAVAEAVEYCNWAAKDLDVLCISGVRERLPEGGEKQVKYMSTLMIGAQSTGAIALAKTMLGDRNGKPDGNGRLVELVQVAAPDQYPLDGAGNTTNLKAIGKTLKRQNQLVLDQLFFSQLAEEFTPIAGLAPRP